MSRIVLLGQVDGEVAALDLKDHAGKNLAHVQRAGDVCCDVAVDASCVQGR